MDATTIVLIVAIVALVAVVAVALLASRKGKAKDRSGNLRERFGPEYDRAVERYGDRALAERELVARDRRMQRVRLVRLTPDAHDRFVVAWTETQRQFVDDPAGAVSRADGLITDLMQARGYPMVDFEQRAADVSVHHPRVVQDYRAARAVAIANAEGRASTEDLRQAFVHYRALFADLLETEEPAPDQEPRRPGLFRKEAHG